MAGRNRRRIDTDSVEPETTDTSTTIETDEAPAQPEGQSEETPVSTATEPEAPEQADAASASDSTPAEGGSSETPATPTAPVAPAGPTSEFEVVETEEGGTIIPGVERIVGERDKATAHLTEALLNEFSTGYNQLDSGQKKKALRGYLTDRIDACLAFESEDGDEQLDAMMKARAYNLLMTAAKKAAPSARATAPVVDPTNAYVMEYVAIQLAALALTPSEHVDKAKAQESVTTLLTAYQNPESDEFKAFQNYLAWEKNSDKEARGEEPSVPDYVKKAVKIAEGKAAGRAGRRTGTRSTTGTSSGGGRASGGGNIATHIAEAMAEQPVGKFVTIAEITKFVSSQYGGDKKAPSAGAVSARLFGDDGPKTVGSVQGVLATDSPAGKKGAKRIA